MPRNTRPDTRSSSRRASSTVAIAASGTALVMAVFSAFVVNVGDSVRTFHADVAGEVWGLSGMGLGLGVALLTPAHWRRISGTGAFFGAAPH